MATANPTALFTTLPRTEFIQKNLGLVHSCAGRFTGRGIEYEELYSAGCLGLVKACDGFDPDRGVCFSTYAVPVILGEIKKLFRDGGTVKVSRSIKELGLKVTAERERLMKPKRWHRMPRTQIQQLCLTIVLAISPSYALHRVRRPAFSMLPLVRDTALHPRRAMPRKSGA